MVEKAVAPVPLLASTMVKQRKKKLLPVRKAMCATCPFRESGWTEVRDFLHHRALNEATPICHSTGEALVKREGPAQLCRGARDFQLQIFYRLGLLAAPTDEAWRRRCASLGLQTL